MAAVVVGKADAASAVNRTSHPAPLPAETEVDHLLLAFIGIDGFPTLSTTSPGWVFLGSAGVAALAAEGSMGVFGKLATDSNALAITSSASEASAMITYAVAQHGVLANMTGLFKAFVAADSTNPNPPNLATGTSAEYLWLVAAGRDGLAPIGAAPAGFTSLSFRAGSAGTLDGQIAVAERVFTGATLDPGGFTSSTVRAWGATTLAVRPGTTGPVPVVNPPKRAQFLPFFGQTA